MLIQMKFGRRCKEGQISMCGEVRQAFFKEFSKNDGCVSKPPSLAAASALEFLRVLRELGHREWL